MKHIQKRPESHIGESKTETYKFVMNQFEGGGAVSLGSLADKIQRVGGLSKQHQQEVNKKVLEYTVNSLMRGQLKDLEGLHKFLPVLEGMHLDFLPEDKNKIMFCLKNFSPSITRSVMLESDPEKALACLEEFASEANPTHEHVQDLKKYGELLLIAHGQHQMLGEIDPKIGFALANLFRGPNGEQLPGLSKATKLPGSGKE